MAESNSRTQSENHTTKDKAFSVDLVRASLEHHKFLRKVHRSGLSLREPTAQEFRRYEHFWLPLLASLDLRNDDDDDAGLVLCPPLDVAWMWHCHRLAPASYRRSCQLRFGSRGALDNPRGAFLGCSPADLADEDGSSSSSSSSSSK